MKYIIIILLAIGMMACNEQSSIEHSSCDGQCACDGLACNSSVHTCMIYHNDSVTIYNCGYGRDSDTTIGSDMTFKEFFNQ